MASSTLESWSVHHLRSLIEYMDSTELLQLTKMAMSLNTADEVATHFSGFLGDDPKALAFIHEFNSRKFPPGDRVSVPSKRAENQIRPGSKHDKPEKRAETKASSRKPVGNTVMSSDLGLKPKHQTVQSQPQQKVKKVDALSEIDAALRDLELTEEKDKKRQVVCDCAARRHGLNQISPNCLSCGKIICSIESYTLCGFCHAQLLNRDQKDEIIAELRRERGVENAHVKQQKKKASAGSGAKMAYSGKLGASYGASRMDEEEVRQKTEAAEKRKDELLAHVQSGYRRTVIDQASDFTSQASDKWSSPAERALALRKSQAALHAEEDRGRVISLSLTGGKVTMKNEKRERRTEEEIDGEIAREQKKIDEERRKEAEAQEAINQSYTRNKLIGQVGTISFPSSETTEGQVDWWTQGQKGWRRVQDDADDDEGEEAGGGGLGERLILSGSTAKDLPGRSEELGASKR